MPKLRLCIHGNRDTLPILMQRLRAAGLARPAADDLPGYHDLLSGLAIWAAAARGNLRILQQNSLALHWARDWRALALTQVLEFRFRPPSWSSVRPSERQELMREQGRATDRRGTREQGPVY